MERGAGERRGSIRRQHLVGGALVGSEVNLASQINRSMWRKMWSRKEFKGWLILNGGATVSKYRAVIVGTFRLNQVLQISHMTRGFYLSSSKFCFDVSIQPLPQCAQLLSHVK